MLSPQQAKDRAQDLVERARRAGADAADVIYAANASEGIQIRLGALEDVERSESEHMALRVFAGSRSASIGSSDLSPAALDELAERAISMARLAPEDAYSGLAPEDMLTHGPWPDLDMIDTSEPSPQDLRALAEEGEDAARAVKGVTNSDGASAHSGSGVFALATSHGFAGSYASTTHSLSVSVVAGEGAAKQRDSAWRQAHHMEDVPSPREIGELAGTRAVERLNPGRVKSGAMPIVFDPRVAGTLVGHFLGAISGSAIARRSSFLLDKLGEQIFPAGTTIVEESLRKRGLRSRPFDGEGLATRSGDLVSDGRVNGWLLDSASARQLGLAPTGHAARSGGGSPSVSVGNIHLGAGPLSPSELMADIKDGIYVTELIGQGVNGVTGDYSRGASGFRIVDGQIAGPVAELTVAGNLLSMFANLTPASDLEWYRAINVPTIRVDGMHVAGE